MIDKKKGPRWQCSRALGGAESLGEEQAWE